MVPDEFLRDKEHSKLDRALYSQPVCTALQITLVDLIQSWGITPTVILGHSSGEIAAAFCAGGLSRDSALKVAYHQGIVATYLEDAEEEPGAMMSVGLSEAEITQYLPQTEKGRSNLSVGCINSPRNITLSGSEVQIDALERVLNKSHIFVRKLKVRVAYHSQQMMKVSNLYRSVLGNLNIGTPQEGKPVMISSVTGLKASRKELSTAEYWVRNMVSPVKFLDTVTNVCTRGHKSLTKSSRASGKGFQVNHLLEIGPHAALRAPIKDILTTMSKTKGISYGTVLIHEQSALSTALKAAGILHCIGCPVDLKAVNGIQETLADRRMLINLPGYPFNHQKKHWLESRLSKCFRFRKFPRHELLGTQVPDWNPLDARWRHIINLTESPWIKDHKVSTMRESWRLLKANTLKINGCELYPATGMLIMAIEATRQVLDPLRKATGYHFREVVFHKALTIPSGGEPVETQLCLRPVREVGGKFLAWKEFRIYAYEKSEWSEISRGCIAVEYETIAVEVDDKREAANKIFKYSQDHQMGSDRCVRAMRSKDLYDYLENHGLAFGPTFQSLDKIQFNHLSEATGIVNLHGWKSKTTENIIQPHVIHPAALDAVLHTSFPALTEGGKKSLPTMVPTKIRSFWVAENEVCSSRSLDNQGSNAPTVNVYSRAKLVGFRNADSSFIALDARSGKPCVVGELESTAVAEYDSVSPHDPNRRRICYSMDWKPDWNFLTPNTSAITAALGLVPLLRLQSH